MLWGKFRYRTTLHKHTTLSDIGRQLLRRMLRRCPDVECPVVPHSEGWETIGEGKCGRRVVALFLGLQLCLATTPNVCVI